MRARKLPKLKPCPFCGGYGTVAQKSKTYIKGELTLITYCYCTDCDSRGRRVLLDDYDNHSDAYRMAISHWNRRV